MGRNVNAEVVVVEMKSVVLAISRPIMVEVGGDFILDLEQNMRDVFTVVAIALDRAYWKEDFLACRDAPS